jgi:hypothetical protein
MRVATWLLLCLAACGSSSSDPGSGSGSAAAAKPVMSGAEIQRSRDACGFYAKQVCACAETVPAAKEPCKLSSALVDSVRVGTEVGLSPDSSLRDVKQANDVVRKTVAECVEQTAKLGTLGCKQ